MKKKKTLFVVGAGASTEVDLPTSDQLKSSIVSMFSQYSHSGLDYGRGGYVFDEEVVAAIDRKYPNSPDRNICMEAGHAIRKGLFHIASIDDFLDTHQDNPHIILCGKLAIAKAILHAEKQSSLYIRPKDRRRAEINFQNHDKVEKSWFNHFFRLFQKGVSKSKLDNLFENISFITFNYDRCIEHFLLNAIVNAYDVDQPTAATVLSRIKIIHPYGWLGPLPWQAHQQHSVEFGGQEDWAHDLTPMASLIRTYTEQIENPAELTELRNEVALADQIIFLGFAFHEPNMKIIGVESDSHLKRIFGTVMGRAKPDQEAIVKNLRRRFFTKQAQMSVGKDRINLLDGTCASLFHEYGLSLVSN